MLTVYTRAQPPCPQCLSAKSTLKAKSIDFVEKVVGTDITLAEFQQQFPGVREVPYFTTADRTIGGLTALLEDLKSW